MSQNKTDTETQSTVEWCPCDEYPASMCSNWPACVDIGGRIWGDQENVQKFRKKNQKKD